MTIFEQTLRDVLIAANLTDDRVFLIRAPQVPADKMKYPYMLFFHIAPSPTYTHGGPLQNFDRDYQISLFDTSQSRALAMADTLRDYLDGFRGDYENVRFSMFQHRNQTHQYETDTKLFQIVQEWRILYSLLLGTTRTLTNPQYQPAVPTRSKGA